MSSHVTSPAGDRIEILSDDDWIALAGCDPGSLRAWGVGRGPVLTALWRHKIPRNPSGSFGRDLFELAKRYGNQAERSTSAVGLFRTPANRPAVDLEINGKRTYKVTLKRLPKLWLDRLIRDTALWDEREEQERADAKDKAIAETPVAPPAPPDVPTLPAPPTNPDEVIAGTVHGPDLTREDWDALRDASDRDLVVADRTEREVDATTNGDEPSSDVPGWDLEVAQSVATALLTRVVEIVAAGDTVVESRRVASLTADLDQLQRRVNDQTELAERYRRTLRETGDELAATKSERDGLRHRLRVAEQNMERVMSTDVRKFIDQLAHEHMDRLVRTPPGSDKGG